MADAAAAVFVKHSTTDRRRSHCRSAKPSCPQRIAAAHSKCSYQSPTTHGIKARIRHWRFD